MFVGSLQNSALENCNSINNTINILNIVTNAGGFAGYVSNSRVYNCVTRGLKMKIDGFISYYVGGQFGYISNKIFIYFLIFYLFFLKFFYLAGNSTVDRIVTVSSTMTMVKATFYVGGNVGGLRCKNISFTLNSFYFIIFFLLFIFYYYLFSSFDQNN